MVSDGLTNRWCSDSFRPTLALHVSWVVAHDSQRLRDLPQVQPTWTNSYPRRENHSGTASDKDGTAGIFLLVLSFGSGDANAILNGVGRAVPTTSVLQDLRAAGLVV